MRPWQPKTITYPDDAIDFEGNSSDSPLYQEPSRLPWRRRKVIYPEYMSPELDFGLELCRGCVAADNYKNYKAAWFNFLSTLLPSHWATIEHVYKIAKEKAPEIGANSVMISVWSANAETGIFDKQLVVVGQWMQGKETVEHEFNLAFEHISARLQRLREESIAEGEAADALEQEMLAQLQQGHR